MQKPARQTCENRTLTVDFQNETTYFQLVVPANAIALLLLDFVLSSIAQ